MGADISLREGMSLSGFDLAYATLQSTCSLHLLAWREAALHCSHAGFRVQIELKVQERRVASYCW